MFGTIRQKLTLGATSALLITAVAAGTVAANPPIRTAEFDMQVSAGAKTCLPNAQADVHLRSLGTVEIMTVDAKGLPPKTNFDFFVLQVPKAPFGVAWYQGDLESNSEGKAHGRFVGRFNIETFAVAPGVAPAPAVFNDAPFPDATANPAFNPIQMYHLGLWFNSPADAQNAGCAATVTPFNGEHNAGIQVLNTAQFADDQGPLRQIHP
jgi:hypothetical protein